MRPKRSKPCRELPDIPPELWPEIMSRLPVKSLLKFRSVSPSWRSIIDDPEFGRLHLTNFRNNRDRTHLLVATGRQLNISTWRCDTFKKHSKVLLTLSGTADPQWRVTFAGDGLVLLEYTASEWPAIIIKHLKVWNPSVRRFHQVAVLPPVRTSGYHIRATDVDIGIGYDRVDRDYRIVRFRFVQGSLDSVGAYSFRGRSWKIISFQGKEYCGRWNCWIMAWKTTVHINGCLYLMAAMAGREHVLELVSYDIAREEITYVDLPFFQGLELKPLTEMALIDGGRSLAVLDAKYTAESDLWVLESPGGSMGWTKRYSFRMNFGELLCFKNNGDMLTRTVRARGSTRWDEVGSFTPQTSEYKIVQNKRILRFTRYHVFGAYLENLFMPI